MMRASDPVFESRTVEFDGAALEVFVGAGQGPVLCTTHPFTPTGGNTLDTLRDSPYIRVLAAASKLVVLQPRGTGRSSPAVVPRDLTIRRLADDLEAVRRTLGFERWAVAGGSSGGQVALLYALGYPDALSALVLFSIGPSGKAILESSEALGSPRHPAYEGAAVSVPLAVEPSALGNQNAEWRQLRSDLWSYWENGAPRLMLPRLAGWPAPPVRHRAALEEFGDVNLAAQLSTIRVPTLIVYGGRDDLVPLRECERLAAIPGAQRIVLEDSGHGLEEIELVGPQIRRFLVEHASLDVRS